MLTLDSFGLTPDQMKYESSDGRYRFVVEHVENTIFRIEYHGSQDEQIARESLAVLREIFTTIARSGHTEIFLLHQTSKFKGASPEARKIIVNEIKE